MKWTINGKQLVLVQGDITEMDTDAIVNAANEALLGGGGVDGAIHRAAGPELLKECQKIGGCPTGDAVWTNAYKLPCKGVIHTVGPVWRGGNNNEQSLLASCYKKSLQLAIEHKCHSIAFAAISTGIYGFPKEKAAEIAINSISSFLEDHTKNEIDLIYLVAFDENTLSLYQTHLNKLN